MRSLACLLSAAAGASRTSPRQPSFTAGLRRNAVRTRECLRHRKRRESTVYARDYRALFLSAADYLPDSLALSGTRQQIAAKYRSDQCRREKRKAMHIADLIPCTFISVSTQSAKISDRGSSQALWRKWKRNPGQKWSFFFAFCPSHEGLMC